MIKIGKELTMVRPNKSNFAAGARLLQSKWREAKGYPMGEYGHHLEWDYALQEYANFLTDYTKEFVKKKLPYLENTPVFNTKRFIENLLSSQPLCFNLFCELKHNPELATIILKKLLPKLRIDRVTKIDFEYSPCRGDSDYTCDYTAFDVFIKYSSGENKAKYFLGIEVKYTEPLKKDTVTMRGRYKELTKKSGMFKDESAAESLLKSRFGQIWRDHLLSISMIKKFNKSSRYEYNDGFFVLLYPKQHAEWYKLIKDYKKDYLNDSHNVLEIHLEDIVNEIKIAINDHWTNELSDWANELSKRYLGNKNN